MKKYFAVLTGITMLIVAGVVFSLTAGDFKASLGGNSTVPNTSPTGQVQPTMGNIPPISTKVWVDVTQKIQACSDAATLGREGCNTAWRNDEATCDRTRNTCDVNCGASVECKYDCLIASMNCSTSAWNIYWKCANAVNQVRESCIAEARKNI